MKPYAALVVLVIGLFVYEFIALRRRRGETISEVVWRLTFNHPLVPFLFGLLMGHFFWQSARCVALLGGR